MVICLEREVQTCMWPSWYHCHSLSLASVKSRLVLPFWHRLTRVVPEKGPLNVCIRKFLNYVQSFSRLLKDADLFLPWLLWIVMDCSILVFWCLQFFDTWLSIWKNIRLVKIELWGVGMVICLVQGTNRLHLLCERILKIGSYLPKLW